MRITFLGTGAADFLPSLENEDRYTVAKDIRRCTATMLDKDTLIDCGPHLMDEIKIHNIEPKCIKNVLVTHNHSDHFSPDELQELQKRCGGILHVWHNKADVMPRLVGVELHPMQLHQTYNVGDFLVTPLGANHDKGAVHFSIVKGDKKLFYGCDGAWFLTDTFLYMRDQKYNMMILDATVGDYVGDFRLAEHNSIPMLRLMIPSFKTWSVADEHTVIVLDHLARTLHKSYEETCELVKEDGFVVAYDGMILEL